MKIIDLFLFLFFGRVTANTIRIESMEVPEKGYWVAMPGFGELGSPSFSRDGEWIAFDAYRKGYRRSGAECWVSRRNGEDLKRLAVGATPRWSPDGKRLIFMRDAYNMPKQTAGIFVINCDGTEETKIGEGRWPDWSPDGTEIVFSVGGQATTGGARVGSTVWIANFDGSNGREIALGDCPSWSPDGKKLACCYRERGGPPWMAIYDLEAQIGQRVGIGFFRGNWMPDSLSLVCNGVVGKEMRMVRIETVEPFHQSELTTEFLGPFSPSCSADGKDLVFFAKRPKVERRP